jgi:hypothetical protein
MNQSVNTMLCTLTTHSGGGEGSEIRQCAGQWKQDFLLLIVFDWRFNFRLIVDVLIKFYLKKNWDSIESNICETYKTE